MTRQVTVGVELPVQEVDLDRLDEDKAVLGFARYAEARIVRWQDFRKGVLLMLAVPGDAESGAFYVFDRARRCFYLLDIPEEGHCGGYPAGEFERVCREFALKKLAAQPRLLREEGTRESRGA